MSQNVLIVDDDKGIISLLEKVLSNEGYNVFTASDSEKTFKILNNTLIQVIYLDLQLINSTGIEICRKIRCNHSLIWICAITGYAEKFEIAECRDAGFDDYFIKPIDLDMILKTTKIALERFNRWDILSKQ